MKIETAPQDVAVHGNFKTSDFNVGDVAFIVDMFADKVYSHKERAVIRELSCNAYDSHVMANNRHTPFNVHLPTTLEPWFSVRDFGTGLSDHEIRTVFAGIGISTKRNNNEVIGCFGIGSLSPYALADSFTVISYHNGTMRTYTCYRDEQRKPVVALLTELETSEPNGLEVSLSVNGRVQAFEDEAENVFRFWEGTLPNINNVNVIKECEKQRAKYIFSGDDFGLIGSYGEMYAIMGNIAYKIPYELDEFRCDGYLKFNLGELEFDTARENLSMTDKVRKAIKAKFEQVKSKLVVIATEQINSELTVYGKAVIADKMNKGCLSNFLKSIDLKQYALPKATEDFQVWQSRGRGCDRFSSKFIPVGREVEYYVHKERMSSRIAAYAKNLNYNVTIIVFKDKQQAIDCHIPVELLKDLESLPKVERAKSSGTKNIVKTYAWAGRASRYRTSDYWSETSIEVDSEKEIVYVELSRFEPTGNSRVSGSNYTISDTISTMKQCGLTIPELVGLKTVFLSSKQFKQGNFIHLDDYVKREFKKIAPKVIYQYNENQMQMICELNKHIIQDELANIVSKKQSDKDKMIAEVCEHFKDEIMVNVKVDDNIQLLIDSFFDKYSMITLVESYEVSRKKHIIAKYLGGKAK